MINEEFCIQVLKEFQKELGGKIIEKHQALEKKTLKSSWWVDVRDYDGDIIHNTYSIWVWKDTNAYCSLIMHLADPECFQKVIDHLTK